MYYCEFCKKQIQKLNDGGVLKIRSAEGQFERGIVVHKGECDEKLSSFYWENGKNTNGFLSLDTLESLSATEKYRVTGELPQ